MLHVHTVSSCDGFLPWNSNKRKESKVACPLMQGWAELVENSKINVSNWNVLYELLSQKQIFKEFINSGNDKKTSLEIRQSLNLFFSKLHMLTSGDSYLKVFMWKERLFLWPCKMGVIKGYIIIQIRKWNPYHMAHLHIKV